jgi:hypothetical protein
MTQFTDAELIVAHNVLSDLKAMFEAEAAGETTPQEAKTIDSAMWFLEEQMSPELQERFIDQ